MRSVQGAIDTPLRDRGGRTPEQVQAIKDEFASRVPLGRIGQSQDIAQAVLFLASDKSRYILGAELLVDGGISQL
jgi:NAD(P)-dependent dehydrogenase (short-subunit alcohol dehydrogenase family)